MGTEFIDIVLAVLSDGPMSFKALYQSAGGDYTEGAFRECLESFSNIEERDGMWRLKQ